MPEAARQSDESINVISNGFAGLKTKLEGIGKISGENGICDSQPSCSKKVDDKFKCPHMDKFLATAYPEISTKHREQIEELIIDDMSLIIFKSMEDYKVNIFFNLN